MKIALLLRGIQQPLLRGCNSIGTPFFLNVFFLKKKNYCLITYCSYINALVVNVFDNN